MKIKNNIKGKTSKKKNMKKSMNFKNTYLILAFKIYLREITMRKSD